MKKLITLFTLAFAINVNAQTNVSGGIYSNTTWSLSGSPYIVTDTVVVFPGVTLTIQPGVTVRFKNNMRIEIRQSTINAIGTSADTITFTSDSVAPSIGIWGNIYVNKAPTCQFKYCKFLYANQGLYADNYADTLRVSNSNFNFNNYGIYTYDFKMQSYIKHCNFKNNATGIYGHEYIFADSCNTSNNQTGISAWGLSHITNTIIDSNSIEGINISAWGDWLLNCKIRYNGIGLHDYAFGPPATISYNIIENNNIGIKLEGFSDTISCNTICNNSSYNLYYTATFNQYPIKNNYWCLNDSILISATIYDGYNNINYGIVNFIPFDTNQCYSTAGISQISNLNSQISIYPNPNNGSFVVETNTTDKQTIALYDVNGKLVLTQTINGKTNIDANNLNEGVYNISIISNEGVVNRRLVIVR